MTSTDVIAFNGLNASNGRYLLPPMTPQQVSALARGEVFDPAHLAELQWRKQQATAATFGVKAGVDPKNLAETGWGVIFAYGADPAIREALSELLDYRREQATRKDARRYLECTLDKAFRPTDTKDSFLARFGAGPGPVDPDRVPYYLLIVGDPETIPYAFQYQLDVQYAVGRIAFDTPDEYARYARSVVTVEQQGLTLARRAACFGVQNPDDPSTSLSANQLIRPLADLLVKEQPDWTVQTVLKDDATKARLGALLGGAETPALLFTASHGIGFDNGDPRQLPHQGALVCREWPGPSWEEAIPPDFYFAADDVGDDARLMGLIAFHFACFGGGTPQFDVFAQATPDGPARPKIAPRSFVAGLPKRLLGHPKGGALAVVGHVERAWGTSFMWADAGPQLTVFDSALTQLMQGFPVGAAMEWFNERYAELSTSLSAVLDDARFGKKPDDLKLASMWTANNDARGYAIIGDPAVRLTTGASGAAPPARPTIVAVTPRAVSPPAASQPAHAPQPPQVANAAPPTPNSQPPAPIPQPPTPNPSAEQTFGVGGTATDLSDQLAGAVKQFLSKAGAILDQITGDATGLEVATYTSKNMANVQYDPTTGDFGGGAKLRALTHLNVDGDTLVCVPEEQGAVDQALWAMHLDMVTRAQANRAELIKAMASAASTLLETVKPG